MQKIGNSTSTANGAGEYSRGQPGSGIDATLITPEWLNAVQRELVNVIIGAGIALDPNDDAQVLTAIQAIQTTASTWAKLTGKPTTVSGFGITDAFTKTETSTAIQQAVAALVASSPAALDTLKELSDALGDDPNFATTITNALAAKASIASIQSQGATAFTSAGTAPAFSLTPVPAIDAYASSLRFQIKFHAAGAGSDTINISGKGPKALKQYDSAGNKVAAVIQGQLTDAVYDGTDVVLLDPLPTAVVPQVGIQGAAKNMMGWADGLSSTVNYWLDEHIVEDGSGTYKVGRNISLAINLAIAGVNGLDIGSVAANSWYSTWDIYNPTTNTWSGIAALCPVLAGNTTAGSAIVTGLTSTASMRIGMPVAGGSLPSGTVIKSVDSGAQVTLTQKAVSAGTGVSLRFVYDPVMPGGYTGKARVGMVLTDGTANKYPLAFFQTGRRVQYKLAAGTNVPVAPLMATGVLARYTPISSVNFVPPTATRITGTLYNMGNYEVSVTPNGVGITPMASVYQPGGNGAFVSQFDMLLESPNIYGYIQATTGAISCTGWEDTL